MNEEMVSARIDQVVRARWESEEKIFREHHCPIAIMEPIPAGEVPIGKWFYSTKAAIEGFQVIGPSRDPSLVEFVGRRGRGLIGIKSQVWKYVSHDPEPCDCEICTAVTERREFKLGTLQPDEELAAELATGEPAPSRTVQRPVSKGVLVDENRLQVSERKRAELRARLVLEDVRIEE